MAHFPKKQKGKLIKPQPKNQQIKKKDNSRMHF